MTIDERVAIAERRYLNAPIGEKHRRQAELWALRHQQLRANAKEILRETRAKAREAKAA